MLISQIVQLDAQSNEFARKHAAPQIGRSDGGESFADYLAATMNPAQSRPAAGEIEASARDRTPVEAHRPEARAEETPDARVKHARVRDGAERASREEKATAEKAEGVPVKKPADKAGATGEAESLVDGEQDKPRLDAERSRGTPVASVNTPSNDVEGEADGSPFSVRKERETVGKAGRVTSRRLSAAKVEIDVEIDLDGAASAKKSADASETSEKSEAKELETRKRLDNQHRNESARARKRTRETLDDRGETASAVRVRAEKAEKTSDSDDRSPRADRRIEVRDLRSDRGRERGNGDPRDGANGRGGSGETGLGGDHATDSEVGDSRSATGRGQFESLRAEGGPTSAAPRGNDSLSRPGTGTTAANLRQTLQENLNAEIVRSARLVVRGNGNGDIRLNLKPEHLGTVRISLQMHDGHIAGRIIVDNQTVREVFEQNLASLQKAFEESGLEAGGVEISLADSGNQPDQRSEEPSHRGSVRDAADRFGYGVPDLNTIDEHHELVDVVV